MSEQRRPFFLRLPRKEKIAFAKRLSMLVRSGIPVSSALTMISAQRSRVSSFIFLQIAEEFAHGKTLSACMAEFPAIFNSFALTVVAVGETTGTLHESLGYLADDLKKQDALRKKIIGALVYPAIVCIATISIAIVLTTVIFPKIEPVFRGYKHELPLSTRVLIALSDTLTHHGLLLGCCFLGVTLALIFVVRISAVRHFFDRMMLFVPIFGRLIRSHAVASFARTVGLLLLSGTPIVQSLSIAAKSAANNSYQHALESVARAVGRGERVSLSLEQYPFLFPPLAVQMIRAGEEAGDLIETLRYVSDVYEEEIADLTRNLTTLLEPVLMVTMGTIVGFVAISIIAPIYGIAQNLSG
ncbi:MAG TPA: type II secretion system F family protein [Candidatus Paceibacterota bacterium]|nr:type II secretion system F family protein [Candidatus Paceibacterota bacterium]